MLCRAYGGDPDVGSVFLQSFARFLLDLYDKESIEDIFKKVCDDVRRAAQVRHTSRGGSSNKYPRMGAFRGAVLTRVHEGVQRAPHSLQLPSR